MASHANRFLMNLVAKTVQLYSRPNHVFSNRILGKTYLRAMSKYKLKTSPVDGARANFLKKTM